MYKKIAIISMLTFGFATASFAANESFNTNTGFYVGGQAGFANMHYTGSSYTLPFSLNSVDNVQFATRIYGGYSFLDWLAVELGYDYFGYPKFIFTPTGNDQDFLQQGIDLVGKASVPLNYGFGLYFKAGAVGVHRGALHQRDGEFVDKEANSRISPLAGIGATYAFTNNMAVDISWSRSLSVSDLPKIDLFGVGIIYKF